MTKIIVLMGLMIMSLEGIASGFSGFKGVELIHQRECVGDKSFEITLTKEHNNPDNCSNKKTINLSCDYVAYKTIVSMTITALATGKEADFWLDGCDSDSQAIVKTIRIRSN